MTMGRAARLAVLTPSLTGQVHLEHAESVASLRLECHKRGVAFRRYYNKGSSVLPRNRNALAAAALADDADWLLWVDGDIAFRTEDVFRLIGHDKPIVGGAPQRRLKHWREDASVAVDLDWPCEVGPDGLLEARGVATAFVLMKAEVFTQLRDEGICRRYSSRDIGDGPSELAQWFWYEIDADGNDVGEDYYFCRRAARLGFGSWLDPEIRLQHFEGLVCHDLCFADIMRAYDGDDHAG